MRKGEKMSDEQRAKIAAGMKGKKNALGHKQTPETRENMAACKRGAKNPNWGKKASRATREKMSIVRLGRTLSLEHRAKISASLKGKMAGPKHPRWLGGISREPYAWEFNAELKEEVRRRDGYKCQLCGVPQVECERALDVHHVDYNKRNSDPVNLVALCHVCNARANANRKHWTALFQQWAIEHG